MSKNKYLLTVEQTAEELGYNDPMNILEEYGYDSVCPACCTELCEVEHDGTCEHGCPSIMIAMGVI